MNLFICKTPLQAVLAHEIIRYENINKKKCALLYLCDDDSNIHRKYYNALADGMQSCIMITSGRSIETVSKIKKLLANDRCNVYLASIDDTLVHYALSFVSLDNLTTFDDGTANIVPSSTYFNGVKRGMIKGIAFKIAHYINGNRYSIDDIKRRSIRHYSIYKNIDNAMPRTIHINPFKKPVVGNKRSGTKNILIGPVYDEITETKFNAMELKDAVGFFMSRLNDCLYIPHPRERLIKKESIDNISEEIITSMLCEYSSINVYGFGSSCQFNLSSVDGIKVIPMSSSLLKEVVMDASNLLSAISGNPVVDIDKAEN